MTLRTGRRCSWESIGLGEVFAVNGCWVIIYKSSRTSYILLEASEQYKTWELEHSWKVGVRTNSDTWKYTFPIYKLPKSVQALWKEE